MTETRKAVFLDRDGTINVDKDYLYKIEEFEYLPGVKDALKRFQAAGYELIIITNQSGIGRGYYTEEDFKKLCDFMTEDLKKDGIEISDIYYCPHLPEAAAIEYRADCDCRKPKPGMILAAANKYNLDLENSYMVGDSFTDVQCGRAAGVKTVFLGDYKCDACKRLCDDKPDIICKSLSEVPEKIN